MPLFTKSSVGSSRGTSEASAMREWPRSTKKSMNVSRTSWLEIDGGMRCPDRLGALRWAEIVHGRRLSREAGTERLPAAVRYEWWQDWPPIPGKGDTAT